MPRPSPKRRGGLLPSERRAIAAMAARGTLAASPIDVARSQIATLEPTDDSPAPDADDIDAVATTAASQLSNAAAAMGAGHVGADAPVDAQASAARAVDGSPEALPSPATSPEPAADPDRAAASAIRHEQQRMLEALLFAASEPLDEATLGRHARAGADVASLLLDLQRHYAGRGVTLVRVAGKWAFRTADDLAFLLESHTTEERRLSKAALETLSIIAYHQPVTRAEIEDIRGVTTSKGTLDVLMDADWIRPRGRRRAPGKPITYGTTDAFLVHFGLDTVKDLPGLGELRSAGLLDGTLPPDFTVPEPRMMAALLPDELPLDGGDTADDAPELPLDDGTGDGTHEDGPADHPTDDDIDARDGDA